MTYAVATVYGDINTFVPVTPQPRSDGIFAAGDDIFAGSGAVYEEGYLFTEWEFRGAALSPTWYSAQLTQLGLDSVKSADVTIRTINNDRDFVTYNAKVIRPGRLTWTMTGWQNVTFRFIWLEAVP